MRFTAILLVGLLLLDGAPSGAEETPGRAVSVLDALQAAVHGSSSPELNSRDLLHTSITRERVAGAGRVLYLPHLPPHCGLTIDGGFDAVEGTALVRRLFAAYGYVARPGFRVGTGSGDLELDGFDEDAKVGFLLLPPAIGRARAPVPDIDASLLRRLRRDGRRVLVLPLAHFRASQGDSLSPLLALALSAVEFLNEITSGPDIDVRGLASGEAIVLPLPDLEESHVPSASTFQVENGNVFFVAEAAGTLELAFRAPAREGTAGVGLLILPWYARTRAGGALPPGTPPRFTLKQGSLAIDSRRPVFVLPSSFDRTKPFRIRVAYASGQSYLGGPVTLRLP